MPITDILRSMLGTRKPEPACRILFVCMGNVCRSPTAEAVFRKQVVEAGLGDLIDCDSAGTHDFNAGSPPDGRARWIAQTRGYDMPRRRSRQVSDEDFERFHLILAMDRNNLEGLERRCPDQRRERVRLLMEFARTHAELEVPDPYYSNNKGFERVLDMIEDACLGVLEHVRSTGLGTTSNAASADR